MAARVLIDESLPRVEVPRRVLHEICQHAIEAEPEECCGLVIGDRRGRYQEVARCRNDMTQHHRNDPRSFPRDGRRAYWMNELDYQRVDSAARARGLAVTAVYHSHVGADAYLSELDMRYAAHAAFPFPESDHFVVSIIEHRIDRIGAFLSRGRGAFVGHRAEASES